MIKIDTIVKNVLDRKNIAITVMGGIERSRCLLRSELMLLFKYKTREKFDRIFHVVAWDADVKRIHNEARAMSFDEMDLKIAKSYGTVTEENISDTVEKLNGADIIVCTLPTVLSVDSVESLQKPRRINSLIVLDGIPIESIEGACCELYERKYPKDGTINLPSKEFKSLSDECWSIILTCNRPFEGVPTELGCNFQVVIDHIPPSDINLSYDVFSSIVTKGPTGVPMLFSGSKKQDGIHDEVGLIVEQCSKTIDSGGIVIFFSSYGKMVEYHNHWEKSGLFKRIGLPYARENRGEGKLKEMLTNFANENTKSIALMSHRFHQNIHFADYVLSSSARLIISVGLPYPFSNDIWDARIKHNDESHETGRILGRELLRNRAIEFLNGLVKRCFGKYRYQNVGLFILDESMEEKELMLTHEINEWSHDKVLGDFKTCLEKFEKFQSPQVKK